MDYLKNFIEDLQRNERFANNIVTHRVFSSSKGEQRPFPKFIDDWIKDLLKDMGFNSLYSHQFEAYKYIMEGKNLLISTGVASGKSLCYQLPIINQIQKDNKMRILLLFPTKALTQDQKQKFSSIFDHEKYRGFKGNIGIYDGDTLHERRKLIREQSNLIFTNPDMLHLGILPHHTKWIDFFRNLKFIIIDEVHIYRGIFGSNFANVIRRLKRIAAFYGSSPQFILTSATLSNGREFIGKLIEEDFAFITEDGSPKGERHVMIYNPPLVDRNLGIRRRAMLETIKLASESLGQDFQTLVFAHSRRLVEMILRYLQQSSETPDEIQAYRSGFLASRRRKIEEQFRLGDLKMTVATNAMELGIDVGQLDVVLINGYPGSIASTLQQAGRAGRKGKDSLAILIATSNLIDQFLVQNPDYIFENSPEEALIDPDNVFVLLHHIKCAVFEKPFASREKFGALSCEKVDQYLKILQKYGLLHKSGKTYYWRANSYPAEQVSLRSAGANEYVLKSDDKIIGTVDQQSAFWYTHPGAIYLHNGESYFVNDLNMKTMEISLSAQNTDYYTQSQSRTEFELVKLEKEDKIKGGFKKKGQIKVTEKVIGFKRIKWGSNEILDYGNLDLPPSEMIASGFWFYPEASVVKRLQDMGLWKNQANNYGKEWSRITQEIRNRDAHTCQSCGEKWDDSKSAFAVHHKKPFKAFFSSKEANKPENLVTLCPKCHRLAEQQQYIQSCLAGLSWLISNIAPFFLMCDRNDIRVHSDSESSLAEGKAAIIIYDSIPGGIGLSDKLYQISERLLDKAASIVQNCQCKTGCPACVGPVAENGIGAKKDVKELLKLMRI